MGIGWQGQRLEAEIERLPAEGKSRDRGLFMRKMADAATAAGMDAARLGLTYPSLRGYISGGVQPSLDFIVLAAGIFGVRPAWLAFGEEPRTAGEQVKAAMGGYAGVEGDLADIVAQALPDFVGWWPRMAQIVFLHTLWRLIASFEDALSALGIESGELDRDRIALMARHLDHALRFVGYRGVRPDMEVQDWERAFVITAMAFSATLPGPGEGGPVSRLFPAP